MTGCDCDREVVAGSHSRSGWIRTFNLHGVGSRCLFQPFLRDRV